MKTSVIQWILRHPYTATSLIFLAIVAFGWRVLGWGERQLGFVLLLYFMVTLGVRLDEISRCLGPGGGTPRSAPGDPETVIAHLKDIKALLGRIEDKLKRPDREGKDG
jgi:hypothetical protein